MTRSLFAALVILSGGVLSAQITVEPPALTNGFRGSTIGSQRTSSGLSHAGFPRFTAPGPGPYAFSIAEGSLPPGTVLQSAGFVTGIPTAEGSFTVTVRATGPDQTSGTSSATFVIAPPPAISLSGRAGNSFLAQLRCGASDNASFDYSTSGSLPPGLALQADGPVSGLPTQAGGFRSFWVCASAPLTLTFELSFTIAPRAAFLLPAATVGVDYTTELTFTGGTAPFNWIVEGGSLPPGLSLAPDSGIVSGTPTAPGNFSPVVRRTDAQGQIRSAEFTIAVSPAVGMSVAPESLAFRSPKDGPRVTVPLQVRGAPVGQAIRTVVEDAIWLQVPPSATLPAILEVSANPAGLEPGEYTATIVISTVSGIPDPVSVPVILTVDAPEPPKLSFDTTSIVSALAAGATEQRIVQLRNAGSESTPVQFISSLPWLTVSPAEAVVGPLSPAVLTLSLDTADVGGGTYRATITASSGEVSTVLPVTITVASSPRIVLSETGIRLDLAPESVSPVRSIQVQAFGGPIDWTARLVDDGSAAPFLHLTKDAGQAFDSLGVEASIPADAEPGDYYAQIEVTADGASNSPQLVTAVIRVLPGAAPPVIDSDVVLFEAVSGGPDPEPQAVTLRNVGAIGLPFTAFATGFAGAEWFTPDPAQGLVPAHQTVPVTIRPSLAALGGDEPPKPGFYRGDVTLDFGAQGVRSVPTLMIIDAAPVTEARSNFRAECAPSHLAVLVTSISPGFGAAAGWPIPIQAVVIDNCKRLVDAGSVVATFSNGNPALPLLPVGNGRWIGTWTPRGTTLSMSVTVRAVSGELTATDRVSGSIVQEGGPPDFESANVVNSANFASQPLAPGTLIRVQGAQLAEAEEEAQEVPWPDRLGGTRVLLAGRPIPLWRTAEGELHGLVPYDIPVDTVLQMIVARGAAISSPESVVVAAVQPVIFSEDGTGGGQGRVHWIEIVDDQEVPVLANAERPVPAGATVLIVATGIGPLNEDGSPWANVVVLFGETEAPAASVRLVEGSPGVYEVRVQRPDGAPAGEVQIVLRVNGTDSAPVTAVFE